MLKSPICYFGGKHYLREEIKKRIPDHKCYCEPFFGSGAVFFSKDPSPYEIVNDIYDDIITFFQIVKTCPEVLISELQYELYSRKRFLEYKRDLEENRENLTPVQRAIRVYYILKASYGGQGKNFKVMTKVKPSLLPLDLKKTIMDAHERLRTTIIENRDYQLVIDSTDRPYTFFFLDPPYDVPGAKTYFKSFQKDDFLRFKRKCDSIQGKFLLTINDNPFIQDLFKGFKIEKDPVRYAVTRGENKKFHELFITNY